MYAMFEQLKIYLPQQAIESFIFLTFVYQLCLTFISNMQCLCVGYANPSDKNCLSNEQQREQIIIWSI